MGTKDELDDFKEIREALSEYIQGIDIESPSDESFKTISHDIRKKISVHAKFELEGIKRWVDQIFEKDTLDEKDYDDRWFNLYVIPYFTSQAIISLSCAYFEEHIKMLLHHHGFTRDGIRPYGQAISFRGLLNELAEATGTTAVIRRYDTTLRNIGKLRALRNKIIHEGGFLETPYMNNDEEHYFPEVNYGYNHIELTCETVTEIIGLMEQFVNMLDEMEGGL